MAIAPQHWLSLARPVVGVVAWVSLPQPERSWIALPLVGLACALDFADGRLARSRGAQGPVGRVVDNLCDFAFLAMFFHAAAGVALWLDPATGIAARWWPRANELPLLALLMSFGAYATRAVTCAMMAIRVPPSLIGRAAGVLNYGLALVGASAISLQWSRPSRVLEDVMLLVVLVNVAACIQNCVLLVGQLARRTA